MQERGETDEEAVWFPCRLRRAAFFNRLAVRGPDAKIAPPRRRLRVAHYLPILRADHVKVQSFVPGMREGTQSGLGKCFVPKPARRGAALLQGIAADDPVRGIHFRHFSTSLRLLQGRGSLFETGVTAAVNRLAIFVNLEEHQASGLCPCCIRHGGIERASYDC
jgi:hypothetical protein